MWCVRRLPFVLVVLAGCLTPTRAHAQIHLEGSVLDNERALPIPGAVVEVLDRRQQRLGRLVADARGVFRFTLPAHGGYRFRAVGGGYRRTTTPVLWTDGHDSVTVQIRLDPEAVLLAPLEVTAWSRSRGSQLLTGFHERIRGGLGSYFTREDIERIRPATVSDLIATLPGVQLGSSGRGSRRTIYFGRAAGAGVCPAHLYVDGFLVNRRAPTTGEDPGFTLDDVVTPSVVEGIEVYKGLATIPAEFLTNDSRCGVVAVWTRRGG